MDAYRSGSPGESILGHDRHGAPILAGDLVTLTDWWPGKVPKALLGTEAIVSRATRSGNLVLMLCAAGYEDSKRNVPPSLVRLWTPAPLEPAASARRSGEQGE